MVQLRRPRRLLGACAAALGVRVGALHDAQALLQSSAAKSTFRQSGGIVNTEKGPVAYTEDGPIVGVYEAGYNTFRKVPYAEPAARFERPAPKTPWAPAALDATMWGPGCIGSHTGVWEQEDCLYLNIWMPQGNHTGMPVMVYIHGGMNQHGSGQEMFRQGDLVVQSQEYPTIFVNFDFRLGIFGWLDAGEQSANISKNLGLLDQQEALKWVHRHIAAFGGDPERVTLEGQSEGASVLMVHMVAPQSASLFNRVIFHSPPADIWARETNRERTRFMVKRVGCASAKDVVACLRQIPAQDLYGADWVAEELSRSPGSPQWTKNVFAAWQFGMDMHAPFGTQRYCGWHPVVDGETILGEPRELIAQGKGNRAEVLTTISKNESHGVFPALMQPAVAVELGHLLGWRSLPTAMKDYAATLEHSGITRPPLSGLLHSMITDKIWTCEVRAMAADMAKGGSSVRIGMFWHSPKYDIVGRFTNPVCEQGATCHAAEMLYALPQGRGVGIHGHGMPDEEDFAFRYRDQVLSFVHGRGTAWAPFNTTTQAITFVDMAGSRVVNRYRAEQCAVLDAHMSANVPEFMRRRSGGLPGGLQ